MQGAGPRRHRIHQAAARAGREGVRHRHQQGSWCSAPSTSTAAEAVGLDEIYDVDADVYSPCALGGTVNEQTLPRLKAKIICGAANNQLATDAIGDEVEKRGILYAPDYAVNAGGVMNVSLEIDGYNRERAMRMMRTIYYNLGRIFEIAKRDGIPTYKAADRMAEERIATIGKIKLPQWATMRRASRAACADMSAWHRNVETADCIAVHSVLAGPYRGTCPIRSSIRCRRADSES